MSFLLFDLETAHALGYEPPTLPPDADPRRAIAPAPWQRIACAGYILLDEHYRCVDLDVVAADLASPSGIEHWIDSDLEPLRTIVDASDAPTAWVTFGGRFFDGPVIRAACMRHGLAFPRYEALRKGAAHIDLSDDLSDHGAARRAGLDAWCRGALGVSGKDGVCGSDVAEMVRTGRLAEVAAYNLGDVFMLALVFQRWALQTGRLGSKGYAAATQSLVAFASGREELQTRIVELDVEALLCVPDAPEPERPPACEACGAAMARKAYGGNEFWGCPSYRTCGGKTKPIAPSPGVSR